jgi:hypothetical protein
MEVIPNYERSRVIIQDFFKIPLDIHITKIKTLQKRLEEKNIYPFRNIFDCKTPIEKVNIKELEKLPVEELCLALEKLPEVK